MQSSTPTVLLPSVCPLSISLAATLEISFDFSSSAYLDVSVQRVSPHIPMHSVYVDTVLPCRVSPFGNLRIYGHLHLPAAYRSLSRPSSAPNAKAFSMCSSSLDLVEANFALLRIISEKWYLRLLHCLLTISASFSLCFCFFFASCAAPFSYKSENFHCSGAHPLKSKLTVLICFLNPFTLCSESNSCSS